MAVGINGEPVRLVQDRGKAVAARRFEDLVQSWLIGVARFQRCEFMTEEDQVVNAGRSTKLNGTPDFLLSRPLSLNGKTVHWVEAKCFCLPGAGNKREKTLAQGGRYVPRYGTGAMVFYHGFVHRPASADAVPEGVMVLDWDYRPVDGDVLLEWPEFYRLEFCAELSVRKKKLWADFDGVLSSVEIHAAMRHPSVRAFQVQVIDAMEEELKRRWKQESRRLFRRANKQNKGGKPTRGSTSAQMPQAQGPVDTSVTATGADDHDSDDAADDDDHSEEGSRSPLPPPPSPLQNRSDSLKSSGSSPVLPPTLQALAEHKYASKRELDKRLKDKNEPRLRALRNLVGNVAEDLQDAWKKKHKVDERLFLLECLAVFGKTPRASPTLNKGRSGVSLVAAEEQCESVLKEGGDAGVTGGVTVLDSCGPSSQACMRDGGRWALVNAAEGGGGDEGSGDGGGGGSGTKGCSSCYEEVELAFRVHAVHLAEDLMMNEQHKEGAARVIMQLRHFTAFLALYHQALNGSGDARAKDSPTSSAAGSSIPSTRGRSLSHQDFRSLSRTASSSSSVSSASPHRGSESRHTSSSPSSSSTTRAPSREVGAAVGNGGGRGRSLSPPPPRHPPRSSSSFSSSASRGVPRSPPPPVAASSSSSALLSLSPPPSLSSSLQPPALLLPLTSAELTLADIDAIWRPACDIARHAGIDLQDVISNSAWLMVLDEVKRNGVKCVERVQRRLAKWVVLCTGRVTPRSARKALKTELKGLLRRSTQPQMTYARLTRTACEILKDPRHKSEFDRWSAVETSLTGLSNQDRMAFRAILIKYNSCRELTEAEVKDEVQKRIADKSKFRRCHRLSSSSIAALDVNRGSSSEGDTLPFPLSQTHLRVGTCSCARVPQATHTHPCAVCMGLSSPYTHESLSKRGAAQKGLSVDNLEVEGGALASTSSFGSSSGGGILQASARRRRRSVGAASMLGDYLSEQEGGDGDARSYHRGDGGDGGGGGVGREWVDVSAWTESAQLPVHEQDWVDKTECEETQGRRQQVSAEQEEDDTGETAVMSLVLYMPCSESAVAAYTVDSAETGTALVPVASCVQALGEAHDDAEGEEDEDDDDDDQNEDEDDAGLPMVEIAAGGACAEAVNEECGEVEDYDFDVVKRGVSLGWSEEVLGGAGEDDWDDWKGVVDDDAEECHGESLCGGIDRRLSSWSWESSPRDLKM